MKPPTSPAQYPPEFLAVAELAEKLCRLIEEWAHAEQEDSYGIMDELVALAEFEKLPARAIAIAKGGGA